MPTDLKPGAAVAVAEGDLVPLSALQHYVVCPRQVALIHTEQLWLENAETAHGRIAHERVDRPVARRQGGVRRVTGLTVRSYALGVIGRADVVEFHPADGQAERPVPVEHKRGRPKRHDGDRVQLCAQGIALEEMLAVPVPAGVLFYGQQRRRLEVAFDDALRARTLAVAQEVRALLAAGRTPAPVPCPACPKCSLKPRCWPDRLEATRRGPVSRYLRRTLAAGRTWTPSERDGGDDGLGDPGDQGEPEA
jgi:CRISPR-associated exonuclease Cas4